MGARCSLAPAGFLSLYLEDTMLGSAKTIIWLSQFGIPLHLFCVLERLFILQGPERMSSRSSRAQHCVFLTFA